MSNAPSIKKRDGTYVPFVFQKVVNAVQAAWTASGRTGTIPDDLLNALQGEGLQIAGSVEAVQDRIEHVLFHTGYEDVFKTFAIYRSERALIRENQTREAFDSIINLEKNDITNDNANMNSTSPAGQQAKFASIGAKSFANRYLLSERTKRGIRENRLYVHDLDYYPTRALNCLQLPLNKILERGYRNGHGQTRAIKHLETAATMACIALQTTQNEMFGGQAIPAFDFYMAPYVRAAYIEEVNNIRDLLVDKENTEYWDKIRNAQFKDYVYRDLPANCVNGVSEERIEQMAMNRVVLRVRQAMQGVTHNFNTMHSRAGNQVVFSSLNYGTDTSAEGRCIIRELLNATYEGMGDGATAIFPIQIWKCKSGASIDPGDPNYDLFKLACKVSARRFFPNFLNLDSSFNYDEAWDPSDPLRYEHEVATMGKLYMFNCPSKTL